MEENNEKYLPLGTVCLLQGGKKYIMVTGYMGVGKENPDKVYDYMGVIFPYGVISSEVTFMFNNDQIAQILFRGYENDESKEFIKKMSEMDKDSIYEQMSNSLYDEDYLDHGSEMVDTKNSSPVNDFSTDIFDSTQQ